MMWVRVFFKDWPRTAKLKSFRRLWSHWSITKLIKKGVFILQSRFENWMEVVLRLNVTLYWAPSSFFSWHSFSSDFKTGLDTFYAAKQFTLFDDSSSQPQALPFIRQPLRFITNGFGSQTRTLLAPFFYSVACKIYKNRPTRQYARCICSLIDFFGHKPCPECVRRALIVVRLQFLFQTCSILSLLSDAPPSTLGWLCHKQQVQFCLFSYKIWTCSLKWFLHL